MEEHQILKELENKTMDDQLRFLANLFQGKIVFSTSFGQEDQVISDLIFRHKMDISGFLPSIPDECLRKPIRFCNVQPGRNTIK
jgi:3'-phosphoadenosine 5'-phosphosulfate sulfotransferase (PAPS reductase)/FAD synthetase